VSQEVAIANSDVFNQFLLTAQQVSQMAISLFLSKPRDISEFENVKWYKIALNQQYVRSSSTIVIGNLYI